MSFGDSTLRINGDDSGSTRLLKEILRSNSYLERGPDPVKERISEINLHATLSSNLKLQESRVSAHKKTQGHLNYLLKPEGFEQRMKECLEGDEASSQLDITRDLSPVLKACGERIGTLEHRLSAAEVQLMRAVDPEEPKIFEEHGIRIVARPTKTPPSASTRMCADRAAAVYVRENTTFPSLETLSSSIEQCESYEELRQLFPFKTKRLHPNLVLLTDYALDDNTGAIHKAIWNVNKQAPHRRTTEIRKNKSYGNESLSMWAKSRDEPKSPKMSQSQGTLPGVKDKRGTRR